VLFQCLAISLLYPSSSVTTATNKICTNIGTARTAHLRNACSTHELLLAMHQCGEDICDVLWMRANRATMELRQARAAGCALFIC